MNIHDSRLGSDFAAEVLRLNPQTLPRYTSYPPANHFAPEGGAALGGQMITAVAAAESVSVYIHIPFCDRLCWFCGCHTKQTLRYDPVKSYVDVLLKEISLWRQQLPRKPKLAQLHLGGGSPSLLQGDDLQRLRAALESCFDFSKGPTGAPEISIEIDPSDVKDGTIRNLLDFGLTRASIGVQDFDPIVQAAINRPQTFAETARVVHALRDAGVRSVNIDALYGLPLQTAERLTRTLDQVLSLQPDRIALFGYAHVPWMKPHQKLINEADLADSQTRFLHARMASAQLVAAGYQAIGIDHFARPADSLAKANAEGRLHRNFQGYTVDDASVLVPLGPSSIGRFGRGFVQNEVATGRYNALVEASTLPLRRGLALSDDDIMRGWIIERLMCDFAFSKDALLQAFGPAALPLWNEAQGIAVNDSHGLCEVSEDRFWIATQAKVLVRLVAARFDAWLDSASQRYSKAV